jgi:hypothetical protein
VRRLTFELSGRQRHGAWPARRMINQGASWAKRCAGDSPLERRVRQRQAVADHRVNPAISLQTEQRLRPAPRRNR